MRPRGLIRIADELWVETRRLRFAGVETGTRMTLVRLADGGLFVHSPVGLDERTREAVDALGPVKAIVAPSRFHHLYVEAWSQAYPAALLCACPGLERKRADLRWDRVLGDRPEKEWQGELDQVFFSARALESEVVFFHPRSRTLNAETAIVFENDKLSGQLADMFYENDLDFSRQITMEDTQSFTDSADAVYQLQKDFGILLEDSL